eukprot:5709433-Pleurochrysis_carterae.AAC.2
MSGEHISISMLHLELVYSPKRSFENYYELPFRVTRVITVIKLVTSLVLTECADEPSPVCICFGTKVIYWRGPGPSGSSVALSQDHSREQAHFHDARGGFVRGQHCST